MLTDADQLPDGAVVETDLCIAGAGAAGISMALEFLGGEHRVALLEAGGFGREPGAQAPYQGRCEPPLVDTYLVASRRRQFGGTTSVWLGYCRPHDDIDFQVRDWVPDSGWPISKATIDPYYRRAAAVCQVEPEFDPLAPLTEDPASRVWTVPFHMEPLHFGVEYRDALVESPNVDVHLHAHAVRLALTENGRSVDHLEVADRGAGKRFKVRARHYVLALGGIENARLLLVSDDVHRRGVGNRYDQVGRYFMEHPVFPVASVCASGDGGPLTDPRFRPTRSWWRSYRISDAEQAANAILNCSLAFDILPPVDDPREEALAGCDWESTERFLESGGRPRLEDRQAGSPELFFIRFNIRPETAPNPESRVTLADEVDRFGQRRTRLAWRMSDIDYRTARRSIEILGDELGRLGLGRARLDPAIPLDRSFQPGWHHMGATRMQDDPKRGVVDRQCQVHGVANLHIAGSSVFCTSGYANPTFTLIALALRLADRLKTRLGGAV